MIIGYTAGVFDLFHIGHVDLLRNAKSMCDKLIVGVTVDDLVTYKGKKSVICFSDRIQVVRACKYVDAAVPQYSIDKVEAVQKYCASFLFVGDDWHGDDKWLQMEKRLFEHNCQVVYFPYNRSTSSTLINSTLTSLRK